MRFLKRLKIRSLTKKLKSLQYTRLNNQVSDEAIRKEVEMYNTLSKVYHSLEKDKKFPFARLMYRECLRSAASLDAINAQYTLGKALLEEAKFRDNLQKDGLFSSESNQRQTTELYREAHAYLRAAEDAKHILAKRLLGLCYINGWGVDADKDKGFDKVVASIDQENSWDKVPQIFASIGLNKPEFFSALVKHRRS